MDSLTTSLQYIHKYKNVARIIAISIACISAYTIRLHALHTYGNVIHEFDPWFNYRATVYLKDNGITKFFDWYDDQSWYPLGRPVGSTIYPGMQFTSVGIYYILDMLGLQMSLNDICCYVPAWFGVLATVFLGLTAYECTGDIDTGIISALIMAIIPAHLMRSVGGGYDNESIAMTAMCATFYFWCRSLRTKESYWYGMLTALAYFYMVATWGGYIFVLNMIAIHTLVLVLMGRCSPKLHRAYSLFYIWGTCAAIQIPIVGFAPLKSLEQLGALGVFGILQLWWITKKIHAWQDPENKWSPKKIKQLNINIIGAVVLVTSIIGGILSKQGYFGPLSSRVRGLFVPHTHTGNPLVDSVAEHRPANADTYFNYLHAMYFWYPIGLGCLCIARTDSKIFIILYGCIAYYFSSKMMRLVVLMGPITSVLAGVALCTVSKWSFSVFTTVKQKKQTGKKQQKKQKQKQKQKQKNVSFHFDPRLKKIAAPFILTCVCVSSFSFWRYSFNKAPSMSHPSIMFQTTNNNGEQIIVDDYRESYLWLRDNTPIDARVMAWWDYGYQINGIAERTTLADGNTWNHEHIALLGRCFASPEKESYEIVRQIADYILIWTNRGGDLAKSPHMARIGNSVYNTICPNDPQCTAFGFENGQPTPMMDKSLIYKLSKGQHQSDLFKKVYQSKFNLVQIYKVLNISQESKEWVLQNPRKYPPMLEEMLKKKEDFKQLENFN